MPKEITEYKEKFLFGLTVRQCVSVAAAIAICVPLFIFGKDILGEDITSWIVILVAVPVFGFGFVKYNGMTFERLLAVIYRQKFAEPQKRRYEELPVFYNLREEIISNEIAYQTARQTAYAKRKIKPPPAAGKNAALQRNAKSTVDHTRARSGAGSSEVEIPVFGVGSLNVKWKKKKGCKYEEKERKQQRKGSR